MRKRFKIKNLIRNKFQRNIFLNGRRSLLLYIGHKLSCNGARYIPSPPGEKVRMRGHKGIVESRQHRYAFLSKGEGGRSPLLHSGCPLQPNMPRSVIPQQFRCIPEGVGAFSFVASQRESVPCGISIGGTFNATGFV